MGRRIVFFVLLLAGSWFDSALGGRGASLVLPPTDMVGQIRVVDRTQNRIVMEERGLEVWATDPRQLDGLVPGQKVWLRFQQENGKQVINSIAPVTK